MQGRKPELEREFRQSVRPLSEVSTMQPSSPLAFVGTFLVALLALLALVIPLIERVTQLSTE